MYYSVLLAVLTLQTVLIAINKDLYKEWLVNQEHSLLESLTCYYGFTSHVFKQNYMALSLGYKELVKKDYPPVSTVLLERSQTIARAIGVQDFTIVYDPNLKCIAQTIGSTIYVHTAFDQRPENVISYILAHELSHVLYKDSFCLWALNKYQHNNDNQRIDQYKKFLEIRADIVTCLLGRSYTQAMSDSLEISAAMNKGPDEWNDHPSLKHRLIIAQFIDQDYMNLVSEKEVRSFLEQFSMLY